MLTPDSVCGAGKSEREGEGKKEGREGGGSKALQSCFDPALFKKNRQIIFIHILILETHKYKFSHTHTDFKSKK